MVFFVLRRLGETAVVLLFLTLIIFSLARLTGDPTPLIVPTEATAADRAFFREQYGLDQSLPEQYLAFLTNIARGEFGASFRYREPALSVALRALGPTLKLTGLAMLMSILLAVPLGIVAALRRGTWIDRAISFVAGLGFSVPSFWVGLLMILVFSVRWPVLPSSGYGSASHYVLPVATLTIYASAAIVRLTRANMVEALGSDFVHLERVLGLPARLIVLKHALRNAALPIVTYLGLQFGLLLGGAVVTERVFAWPGIGQTVVEAVLGRDYPVIQAAVLLTALMFISINLAVDVICVVLDPRSR